MRITTFLPAVAIAVLASFGSAWAGDGFATLDGVAAVPMTSEHMAEIRGTSSNSAPGGGYRDPRGWGGSASK